MRVICPITHAADIVAEFQYPSVHDCISPVTAWVYCLGYGIEIPHQNVGWPPGKGGQTHELSDKVLSRGHATAQEEHDLGSMLPHVTVAPAPNFFNFSKHPLLSSCKMMFKNGEVLIEGKPAGCTKHVASLLGPLPAGALPMMMCGFPMSLPSVTSQTNASNSIVMGMHMVDVIAGWVRIAVQMVVDLIKAVRSIMKILAGAWGEEAVGPFVGGTPDPVDITLDNLPGFFAGLVELGGRGFSDYHGPAGFDVEYRQGELAGGKVGFEWTDDGVDLTGEGQVRPEMGPYVSKGEGGVHITNDGEVSTQFDGQQTGPGDWLPADWL